MSSLVAHVHANRNGYFYVFPYPLKLAEVCVSLRGLERVIQDGS